MTDAANEQFPPPVKPDVTRISRVQKWHAEGQSYTYMAEQLGCTRNVIAGLVNRYCPKRAPKPYVPRKQVLPPAVPVTLATAQPELLAAVKADIEAGVLDSASIARKHNMNIHTVKDLVIAMGGRQGKATQRDVENAMQLARIRKRLLAEAGGLTSRPLNMERFAEGYEGQRARVDLKGLKLEHCRFPIDQREGGVKFCGLDAMAGRSYCPEHHARCTQPYVPKKRVQG